MVFVNATDQPILSNPRRHNPDLARAAVHCFGLEDFRSVEWDDYDEGTYPPRKRMSIGGHDRKMVIFNEKLAERCLVSGVPPFVKDILAFWPESRILALVIDEKNSDCDGFALFANGTCQLQAGIDEIDPIDPQLATLFREIVGCHLEDYIPDMMEMSHYSYNPDASKQPSQLWINIGCLTFSLSFAALVTAAVAGIVQFIRTS